MHIPNPVPVAVPEHECIERVRSLFAEVVGWRRIQQPTPSRIVVNDTFHILWDAVQNQYVACVYYMTPNHQDDPLLKPRHYGVTFREASEGLMYFRDVLVNPGEYVREQARKENQVITRIATEQDLLRFVDQHPLDGIAQMEAEDEFVGIEDVE